MIERKHFPQESNLKRVLVISSKDILSVGVAGFLSREDDFEVINKNITDNSALVSALEELRPVVLIINESLLKADCPAIFGWLRDFPAWCVIVLNEQENLLHIYEKQEVVLGGASDLVAIIRRYPSLSDMDAFRYERSARTNEQSLTTPTQKNPASI